MNFNRNNKDKEEVVFFRSLLIRFVLRVTLKFTGLLLIIILKYIVFNFFLDNQSLFTWIYFKEITKIKMQWVFLNIFYQYIFHKSSSQS